MKIINKIRSLCKSKHIIMMNHRLQFSSTSNRRMQLLMNFKQNKKVLPLIARKDLKRFSSSDNNKEPTIVPSTKVKTATTFTSAKSIIDSDKNVPSTTTNTQLLKILNRKTKPDIGNSTKRPKQCFTNPSGIRMMTIDEINEVRQSNKMRESISSPLMNPDRGINVKLPQILPVTHSTFPKEHDLPAITSILRDTMPAEAAYKLQKWRESMIRKLGEAGFNQFTIDTFNRGKKLHSMVEHFFLGKEPPKESSDQAQNLWRSIEGVLKERVSNVRLVEHTVIHSEMGYRGIVDAVAYFDNSLTVIDFKTTVKQKVSDLALYDGPLQVSAYCGALNHDPRFARNILGSNVTSGVLIYAYTDGSPATVHHFDCEKLERYWSEWCTRLNQYQKMQKYKEQ